MFIEITKLFDDHGRLITNAHGGYALTFLDQADNVICSACADNAVSGNNDYLTMYDLKGAFVHWEGDPLLCDECGSEIESEY